MDLFSWLESSYSGETGLKAYASRTNPNAFSPPDLWGCLYPRFVGHGRYALQVALIIRADGAELCFCLGAGWAQVNNAAKVQELTAAFAELLKRLAAVPADVIRKVEDGLDPAFVPRKRWRQTPAAAEFPNLQRWLSFAAGDEGSGASVSRYYSPNAIEDLGQNIANEVRALLSAVSPLIEFVYGASPPPVDSVAAALDKFDETADPDVIAKYRNGWQEGKTQFDETFGSEANIDRLSAEAFFAFLNQIDSHINAESGLFRLGPGLPAPKDRETETWRALVEDLPKLRDCLKAILFTPGAVADRVDAALALAPPRRYIADLALASMLYCFVDEGHHSGVNRMRLKERTLAKMGKLPAVPSDTSTGQRFVAWDDAWWTPGCIWQGLGLGEDLHLLVE